MDGLIHHGGNKCVEIDDTFQGEMRGKMLVIGGNPFTICVLPVHPARVRYRGIDVVLCTRETKAGAVVPRERLSVGTRAHTHRQ